MAEKCSVHEENTGSNPAQTFEITLLTAEAGKHELELVVWKLKHVV